MRINLKYSFLIFSLLVLSVVRYCEAQFIPMHRESNVSMPEPRTRINFNKGWKFSLGDADDIKTPVFNDSKWRKLTLPHDWSIEGKFDEKNPSKPEGGGLPTGIGWYRKEFNAPVNFKDQVTTIEFDGVYKNSEVWLNGHFLGRRPFGYISFSYELSKYLKAGKNIIAVKVDNSAQPDSRWYSGSGIYRNVWLSSTAKIAIAQWGVKVVSTVPDNIDLAVVNLRTTIQNKSLKQQQVTLINSVYDASGKLITKSAPYSLKADTFAIEVVSSLNFKNPIRWTLENPHQYKLVTQVIQNNKVIDTQSTLFGVRTFNFDAKSGFSLNGKALKINGVCMHHDLGALGAAVNTRAIERQLEILKEMGCNAIRTAHNPPAPEFLDLCDKMGFLVMDESFDVWKKKKVSKDYNVNFDEWHKTDLQDMIKRDFNHPSIILWSIGNEIREQFDSTGIAITKELVKIVKDIDRSRQVISALTETVAAKNFIYQAGVLDIYGLNYNHKKYKDFPVNYPNQPFIATETTSAFATRGFYDTADSIRRWPKDGKTKFTEGNASWAVSAYDTVSAYWGSTHEETLKEAKKYNHVSGIFVWSGFDFLGEPIPYPWPARSSYYGIVDLAGFPKDSYYLYQSEWTTKPVLHILPHWNWPINGLYAGKQEKAIDVWAYYNNADEVELYLNGKSEVLVKEIKTAGKPSKIELIADRKNIKANGTDLSFVTVKITDEVGNLVPNADNLVQFKIEGVGFVAGVDNGFQASLEPFKANYRKAYNGLCLAIIQATEKTGTIKLIATAEGLKGANLVISTKREN
jgi:beta-galactosidase